MTEDPLDRIRRLQDVATTSIRDSREKVAHSKAGQVAREVTSVQRFVTQIVRALVWLWWNVGNPAMNIFTVPIFKWIISTYRRLWERFTFRTDEFGTRVWSVKRGAVMLALTMFLGFSVWDVGWFAFDVGLYVLTAQHNEEVYLFKSEDNSFTVEGDDFSISGCEISGIDVAHPFCDQERALYFRLSNSWFNNVWSMWTNGSILHPFLPDYVAAVVVTGWNRCYVTSYGFRFKFLRYLNWYPEILDARCEALK